MLWPQTESACIQIALQYCWSFDFFSVGCFVLQVFSCNSVDDDGWSLYLTLLTQCRSSRKLGEEQFIRVLGYMTSDGPVGCSWLLLGILFFLVMTWSLLWPTSLFSKLMFSYTFVFWSCTSLAFCSWIRSRTALFTPGPKQHKQLLMNKTWYDLLSFSYWKHYITHCTPLLF